MKKQTHEFIKFASVPLGVLGVLLAILLLYQFFDLPTYAEMTAYAKTQLFLHGYWVVFLGALAEGILFFNWYIPGSVVVVMGGVFAQEAGMNIFNVVGLIILGFWLTTVFNYILGRYGWYRILLRFGLKDAIETARKRVERHGLKIIFGTYFHPNVGALTATSAGILRLSFSRFLYFSTMALIAWNALWGAIAYYIGPPIVAYINYKNLILLLGLWIVILFFQFIRSRGKVVVPEVSEKSL